MSDTHELQRFCYPGQYFFLRPLQLQGREGDLIEDGGIEKLHIRVLEDQRHPGAKGKREAIVCEVFRRQGLSGEADYALRGKTQTVQKAQQRGLARTVRAHQCDALASAISRESPRSAEHRRNHSSRRAAQTEAALVLSFPQGLRPERLCKRDGTAEAVPVQNQASYLPIQTAMPAANRNANSPQ